jgi:hypothetical protein
MHGSGSVKPVGLPVYFYIRTHQIQLPLIYHQVFPIFLQYHFCDGSVLQYRSDVTVTMSFAINQPTRSILFSPFNHIIIQ